MSQLIRDPALTQLGLAVNTRLNTVVCLGCKVALGRNELAAHIRDQHVDSGLHINWKLVNDILIKLEVLPDLPTLGHGPYHAFQGLATHHVLLCSHCSKTYKTEGSITWHHKTEHNHIPIPRTWTRGLGQQLDRGGHKTYFTIYPPPQNPNKSHQDIITDLRKRQLELDGTVEGERLDPRLLSPWLKSTKWLDLIARKDTTVLRSLAAIPQQGEFPNLNKIVAAYYAEIRQYFELLPELVLQRLHSPDPSKE